MKLLKPFSIVSGFALISSLLGYIRDSLIIVGYGTSGLTDAYVMANLVPNAFYAIFITGSLVQVTLPVLVEYRLRDAAEARKLALTIFNATAVLLLVVASAAIVSAPVWIPVLMPGATPDTLALTAQLSILLFPTLIWMGLFSITNSWLHAHDRFTPVAIAPLAANAVIIASIILSHVKGGILTIALGTLLGMSLQMVILIPGLVRSGLRWSPYLDLHHPALRRIFRAALPLVIYLLVAYASVLVERRLASGLAAGSITIMEYGLRLMQQIPAIFSFGLVTVLYPHLAQRVVQHETAAFRAHLLAGQRVTVFVLLPATVWGILNSHAIIAVLLGYGQFTPAMTELTAQVFGWYLVGMLPLGMAMLAHKGLFALGNTRTPLMIECANLLLYCSVAPHLSTTYAAPGLTAARVISFLFVGSLLVWQLWRSTGINWEQCVEIGLHMAKVLLASSAIGLIWFGMLYLEGVGAAPGNRLPALMVNCVLSICGYLCVAFVLRIEEIRVAVTLLFNNKHIESRLGEHHVA